MSKIFERSSFAIKKSLNDADQHSTFKYIATDESIHSSLTNLGAELFRGTKGLLTGFIITSTGVSKKLQESAEWNEAVLGLGNQSTLLAKGIARSAWKGLSEAILKSSLKA